MLTSIWSMTTDDTKKERFLYVSQNNIGARVLNDTKKEVGYFQRTEEHVVGTIRPINLELTPHWDNDWHRTFPDWNSLPAAAIESNCGSIQESAG